MVKGRRLLMQRPFGLPKGFLPSSDLLRLQARAPSCDDRRRQVRFERPAGLHPTIYELNPQCHSRPSLPNDDKPPGKLT